MTETVTPLDALRSALAAGRGPDPGTRRALLESDDPVELRKAAKLLTRLPAGATGLRDLRVVILGTCTVGSFEPLLRAGLVGAGFLPTVEKGEYGTFEMTLATATFGREADPDLLATLLDAAYFLPADWSPADLEGFEKFVEARLDDLLGLIGAALERTAATMVVHTVPLPGEVRNAFVGLRARARVSRLWNAVNTAILELSEEYPQVVAVDLVADLADAPAAARDARLHRYGDMPYTDGALLLLARQVRRVAQAKSGLSRKVLALDLDNTLWGGVVGEVGAGGVELGGLYPGNSYLALQRTAYRLREQGVILVLASKNESEVVEEALTGHPEMLLRPEAFSVSAVNWSAKAGNLSKAAESLNVSVDSFVFMDDSDFEREHVAGELPGVAIVSAAGDPAYLAESLLRHGWFDVMTLTDSDRKRPELYRGRAMRSDFSTGFGSSEEFLKALDLRVRIAEATEFTIGRIAQLAARTNQFNLTGIRFDETATAEMSASADHLVLSVEVSDRFGDEGIVGALWAECGTGTWRVLNMVLSCRVLGRGIELATVAWLGRAAVAAGATALQGRFVPSPKNGVAAGFWTTAGFVSTGAAPDVAGGTDFAYDLAAGAATSPTWITFRERSDAR